MGSSEFDKREFYRLMGDLCNETVSVEDHVRLQELLKTHATARQEYLHYVDLHYGLRKCLRVGDESVLPTFAGQLSSRHLCSIGPASWVDSKHHRRLVSAMLLALAVVLLLACCVSVAWYQGHDLTAWVLTPVAQKQFDASAMPSNVSHDRAAGEVVITQVAGCRFFGEAVPAIGQAIGLSREYALTQGMIELRFPAGATTIIESPAVFEVSSISRLLLHTGKCSVHAPDGAQGFRVDTPLGNVVDLGTRFVVDVLTSGATDVHVIEGEADVFPKHPDAVSIDAVSERINLRGGQANRLSAEGNLTARDIPFQSRDYKSELPDRIIKFDAVEDQTGAVDELISVTVQRGGNVFRYGVDELIGIDVIHFQSTNSATLVTPAAIVDAATPNRIAQPRSRYLDRSRSLCSGLINPGGQSTPLDSNPVISGIDTVPANGTPGLGIRFQTPLENSLGPDLVLFELQTIVNSEQGDAFHIGPLHFSEGLRSITVDSYDIDLVSPQSKFLQPYRLYRLPTAPTSLHTLLSMEHVGGPVHTVRAKVLAVGIDLSDLGYRLGETVDGLFLQDAADDRDIFDPIFIGGFPPTP